ncbi:MAG: hypothetical protein KF754_00540 [Planctomycetes bacterium]|nr:hypothetical protein [Planctomycetota bacterium]
MSRLAHVLLALLVAIAPVIGVCHCEPGAMLRIMLACPEPSHGHSCTHHGHDSEGDLPDSPDPKCPIALNCAAGLDLLFEPAQEISAADSDCHIVVMAARPFTGEAHQEAARPLTPAVTHPPPLRGHLRFCRLHI